MDVTIRRGEPKDFPAILFLIKEFSVFQRTPHKVTITPEQMSAAGSLFSFFVAETGEGQIVGFATYFFAWYSWSGKSLYLDDLYVVEAYRKRGIGQQLFETLIQLAKSEACVKLRWQVSKWNAEAIEYYKNMGATIDNTELNCEISLYRS